MFRYMRLVDMLKEVINKGRQVKDVVYKDDRVKRTEVGACYSLLNLVINNYSLF